MDIVGVIDIAPVSVWPPGLSWPPSPGRAWTPWPCARPRPSGWGRAPPAPSGRTSPGSTPPSADQPAHNHNIHLEYNYFSANNYLSGFNYFLFSPRPRVRGSHPRSGLSLSRESSRQQRPASPADNRCRYRCKVVSTDVKSSMLSSH